MTDISIEDTGTNVTVDDNGVNVTVGGAQGPAGPPGEQGEQGLPGVDGTNGAAGANGTNGTPGEAGPAGAQGPQGEPGADSTVPGPQGIQGPDGPQGLPGGDGAQGEQGIQGITGEMWNWRGEWSQTESYALNDAVYQNGASYLCVQAYTYPPDYKQPGHVDGVGYWEPIALGIKWQLEYNPVTTYMKYDAVTYGGSSFISTIDSNLDNEPGVDPGWDYLASIGNAGPQGEQGEQGDEGPNVVYDGGTETDIAGIIKGDTGYTVPAEAGVDYAAPHDHPYIPNTLVDAKGDIITATADDTPAKITVGADGEVLTADSGEATGVKWAAGGGGGTQLGFWMYRRIGYYYGPSNCVHQATGMNTALATNELWYFPFIVGESEIFDRLSFYVGVAGAAGKLARVGIYNDGGAGVPTTLVLDAGEVLVDSTGAKTIVINQTLSAGLYWLCIVSNGTPEIRYSTYKLACIGESNDANAMIRGGLYSALGYAVLPTPAPAITGYILNPLWLQLRKSA